MDKGDVERFYKKSKLLNPAKGQDRILLMQLSDKIEAYCKTLVSYSISEGWNGNDDFIEQMEYMIAEIKSRIEFSNNDSKMSTVKLRWNGSVKELAYLFDSLKNKPSRKKDKNGNTLRYLDCKIEQLTDFIYGNFEADRMTKETIRKCLKDKSKRKLISI